MYGFVHVLYMGCMVCVCVLFVVYDCVWLCMMCVCVCLYAVFLFVGDLCLCFL